MKTQNIHQKVREDITVVRPDRTAKSLTFSACETADTNTAVQSSYLKIPDWLFDDEFDGGDETCGRVIVNLYLYIRDQEPGFRILVISRDPGAPVELPAWCRMTKNELTEMQHPYYLITIKPHLARR